MGVISFLIEAVYLYLAIIIMLLKFMSRVTFFAVGKTGMTLRNQLYPKLITNSNASFHSSCTASFTQSAIVTMPKEGATPRRRKEETSRKKKKDPNAPKRSLSAYMFFANENRDSVRNENPGITFGQIGRLLGEKWKALSVEEKVPYEDKAQQDKKRYDNEMQIFKSNKQAGYEQ